MDILTEDHLFICERKGAREEERERRDRNRERGGGGAVEGEKKEFVRCEVSKKVWKI